MNWWILPVVLTLTFLAWGLPTYIVYKVHGPWRGPNNE